MLYYPKRIPLCTLVVPNANIAQGREAIFKSLFLKFQCSQHLCIKETDEL